MATKTIKAGGDYTTMSGYAAYLNALTLSAPEVGLVTGTISDTVSVVFGGWTGESSTNKITIKPDTGVGFKDNANVRTNALRYNTANGAALTNSSASGGANGCIVVNGDWTEWLGLQLEGSAAGYLDVVFQSAAANITIQDFIVSFDAGRGSQGGIFVVGTIGTALFENIAIVIRTGGFGSGGFTVNHNGNPSVLRNITIVKSGGGTLAGIGDFYSTNPIVINCAIFGFTFGYIGTADGASTNNATDAVAFSGTGFDTNGQVSVATSDLMSVTNGSEDLRESPTAAKLKANGATSGISTDISGTAKSAPYDIGCWFLTATGSAIKTINGLAKASIKTINGLAIASMKSRNGLQ